MTRTLPLPYRLVLPAFAVLLFCLAGCGDKKKSPPYSPQEALKTFRLPDGFKIELVASEPLISDPVEIAFDENGFLYVAEMRDYPASANPGGRISRLEDKDGDGHYETGGVFADSLPYVNGVMPWKKGVLVTTAPDILYLEDTTGDGRADIRRVVLTGFAYTNPQLRVSSLRYGIDNWIYGAYSRAGGQRGYPEFTDHGHPLTFPDNPIQDSVDIYPGTDFRVRPDSFWIEPAGGMSQFGMAFDAEGNRFTVWNNIHARHVVVDGRYPPRNPWLAMGGAMASVSDHGDAAPVFSAAENRMDLHESEVGHFTSACGNSVYTGDLFPAPYRGAAFVCEPVSSIVHADLLAKNGVTFSAKRAAEGAEFLSSTDSWFRPVNTTVGPDGGLYVVDFYRKLVEHPAWIARADEKGIHTYSGVLQDSDFVAGHDRGRIYRVVPRDFRYTSGDAPRLGSADTRTLVQALAHPNMWWRLTAQRLLATAKDKSAVRPLKEMVAANASPYARMHALRTLDAMDALDDNTLLKGLSDADAGVRRQAILLSEPRLMRYPILRQIRAMAADADTQVQFQIAITLSALESYLSFEPLKNILLAHMDDPWFRTAVLLSAGEHPFQWFEAINDSSVTDVHKAEFLRPLASIMAARDNQWETSQMLVAIREGEPALQRACLQGLGEGLRRAQAPLTLPLYGQNALVSLMKSSSAEVRDAATTVAEGVVLTASQALASAVREALAVVADRNASPEARAHGVRVAGLDPAGTPVKIFEALLVLRETAAVQEAAARVLSRSRDASAVSALIRRWPSATAPVRRIIEEGLCATPEKSAALVTALERGQMDAAALTPATRSALMSHPDRPTALRAEKLLASAADTRDKVVTAFYEATTAGGDPAKGRLVFEKACSTCHMLGNVGRAFGPDLLSVTNQTRINLLAMILDPNSSIAAGYDGYVLETNDGRSFTGILASETPSGIVLRTADGLEQAVARNQIRTLRPLPRSLMPDGLEAGLTKEDIADLLEFLKKGAV